MAPNGHEMNLQNRENTMCYSVGQKGGVAIQYSCCRYIDEYKSWHWLWYKKVFCLM